MQLKSMIFQTKNALKKNGRSFVYIERVFLLILRKSVNFDIKNAKSVSACFTISSKFVSKRVNLTQEHHVARDEIYETIITSSSKLVDATSRSDLLEELLFLGIFACTLYGEVLGM